MTASPLDANIEKWYVMAAYKFELKAEASLREAGIEVYLPKETIYVKKPRRRPVAVERPAISTLIFVHASWSRIIDYKRRIDDRLKFKMTPIAADTTRPPLSSDKTYLTVPEPQMAAFISIWATRDTLQASLTPLISSTSSPTTSASPTTFPVTSLSVPATSQSSQKDNTHKNNTLPIGTTVEITDGPLSGLRATTLTPITSRSRTTRLSLPLASLLTITISLPTSSLSPIDTTKTAISAIE